MNTYKLLLVAVAATIVLSSTTAMATGVFSPIMRYQGLRNCEPLAGGGLQCTQIIESDGTLSHDDHHGVWA